MRINKIQLAGLAVALAGGVGVNDAKANDVTISNASTTPVVTSLADGVSAGDVTIASGGSITVTTGQNAVTVDSNNDVSNAGLITSNDANNSTGIFIEGGYTSNITNTSTISLIESYVLADSNADGDLDGLFAQGTNRHGIFLDNAGTLTGNILNSGPITVEGNNSSAITLNSLLNGNLTNTGAISMIGDNSVGIAINGGATGDVILRGNMFVRGENSSGLIVNGAITGDLVINGTWSVSGFHNVNRPANVSNLDADDLLIGGSAIGVYASVGGGIVIEGVGVEDDTDDDNDGTTEGAGDTDDDLSAAIIAYGSAPAMLIQADGSNIVIGTTSTGYGVHIQGSLTAAGVYDNFDATALRIEGVGGNTVTIADGITVDNQLQAVAQNADAYGLVLGQGASVSELLVRRNITTFVTSDLAQTAYGVVLEAGANLPSIVNDGTMRTTLFGEIGNSVVILDNSNTLANITNTGAIIAQIVQTDSDLTDDIPPPAITGDRVAIDVSASTISVTLNQVAPVVFTDEDGTDDDAENRPDVSIEGDIRFGSGNDTINLLFGEIDGDITFGAGADTFFVDNGAFFVGGINDSDGALTINVQDGIFTHTGGTTNFTTGTFAADAVLGVVITDIPANSTFLHASGDITFAPGSQIVPIVPQGLPVSGTHTFLTADGSLFGAANVIGPVTADGVPFLYNLSIATVLGDPDSLAASYLMKTTTELGLNRNQTTAFDHIIAALRLDDSAAAAFASLASEYDFDDAYADLMPSYASAATELATTAVQQSQSATTNRMAHTRLHGLDEVSVWVQEIAYGLNRTPADVNGQEFRGQGFGLAVGIDGPLDNGAMFGLSASFLASEAEEPARPEGEISSWFGQGNAYLGTAMGPIDLDFVVGAGFGKMQSRRFVEIGTFFAAQTDADWWAYEGHGSARASMPMALGDWFVVTPQAQLTYVALGEQGYTEDGGGPAIDLEADTSMSQRLWADAGVEFSARWSLRGGGFLAPRFYAGYRANVIDEEAERTFRFVSTGTDFTLQDEGLGSGGPLVGIGIDATNGYSTFSLSYEGEFGDQIERHSLNAAVRFRF